MKYLLDTNAVIWLLQDKPRARKIFELVENGLCAVSALSIYEIYSKKALGKLRIPDKIETTLEEKGAHILPVTTKDSITAAKLPLIHFDPVDRIIVAQAANRHLLLVTADSRMLEYPVKTLEI